MKSAEKMKRWISSVSLVLFFVNLIFRLAGFIKEIVKILNVDKMLYWMNEKSSFTLLMVLLQKVWFLVYRVLHAILYCWRKFFDYF